MKDGPAFTRIGALVGDPARANILTSLMSGQALTASELTREAGVTPQTASGHLAQLLDGGLISVEKQGRHRYYRLAGADVAAAIEAMMTLAEQTSVRSVRPGPKDPALRHARVCYDHLAGERSVDLYARLSHQRLIALDASGIAITPEGETAFAGFGIDLAALQKGKRPVCRTCLDWSERKTHLAGALGARLLDRLFELNWAERLPGGRIVRFTTTGEKEFARLFTATT
jgi:DNA-binding transcriptional ArsR family regulator